MTGQHCCIWKLPKVEEFFDQLKFAGKVVDILNWGGRFTRLPIRWQFRETQSFGFNPNPSALLA
ncbi:MAG: hypothetical protein ACR2OA_06010 [Rubripirellula sp.]|jgi:hypothetical protein